MRGHGKHRAERLGKYHGKGAYTGLFLGLFGKGVVHRPPEPAAGVDA